MKCKLNTQHDRLYIASWNRPQNILNRIEIVQSIFSDHNGIKLESHKNKILGKNNQNISNLNNILPNKQLFREERTGEIKQYAKVSNNKISTYQNGGIHLKQCLKEILFHLFLFFYFLTLFYCHSITVV